MEEFTLTFREDNTVWQGDKFIGYLLSYSTESNHFGFIKAEMMFELSENIIFSRTATNTSEVIDSRRIQI